MTKNTNTIKKSILSAAVALVLAAGLAPAAAFADITLASTLSGTDSALTTFTDSIERMLRTDSAKVYAATARAAGHEEEAVAIEAEAAAVEASAPVAATPSVAAPAAAASAPAPAAPAAVAAPSPDTITIGSSVIPFVQCYLAPAAPDNTAGLWWGNSSTTDGGLGYFVGHNPGVFAPVVSLTQGNQVTVTDGTGASHTYTVIDVFDVKNTTTLQDIQPRITGHGESIAMQACIQGGAFYRVVVAA